MIYMFYTVIKEGFATTSRAWLTGYYIVEYEQHGADRAKYGVMRKARRCLAFLYSVGEDAVEVMTWYDSSAAA